MTPVRSAGGERAVSRVHLVPGGDATGTLHSVFAAACNLAIDGTLVTVHDVSAARTTVAARTDGVLRTGASSGADAVAGAVLGVRALVPPPDQKAA